MSVFHWPLRVYWEDTDAGGIVYYANYLRFLERARSEWLHAHCVSQRALALDPGIVFSVVEVQAQYHQPARLEDQLLVSCEPALQGGASMRFEQRIWRQQVGGELLLTAAVRIACLSVATMKPKRLPPVILRLLAPGAAEEAGNALGSAS